MTSRFGLLSGFGLRVSGFYLGLCCSNSAEYPLVRQACWSGGGMGIECGPSEKDPRTMSSWPSPSRSPASMVNQRPEMHSGKEKGSKDKSPVFLRKTKLSSGDLS